VPALGVILKGSAKLIEVTISKISANKAKKTFFIATIPMYY
jgi:hypothetical protein